MQALRLLEGLANVADMHIDLDNNTRPIGVARCNRVRDTEVILFEYDRAWLSIRAALLCRPRCAPQ
jgi:hypothetical protein